MITNKCILIDRRNANDDYWMYDARLISSLVPTGESLRSMNFICIISQFGIVARHYRRESILNLIHTRACVSLPPRAPKPEAGSRKPVTALGKGGDWNMENEKKNYQKKEIHLNHGSSSMKREKKRTRFIRDLPCVHACMHT